MKTKLSKLIAIAAIGILTACTRVESGQVGVIRKFNGEFSKEPVNAGLHLTIFDTIYPFSTREIAIQLDNLKPTTKNNSSILSDLDFSVQYSVNPDKIPEIAIKYRNMSPTSNGTILPAFDLVNVQARSVSADAVSKFDALEIGSKRNELEAIIKSNLQSDLDKSDPNTFYINRVSISNLLPDDRIQKSLIGIAESENKKQTALTNLEIAKIEAEENKVRSMALDDKILAKEQLETLKEMSKSGNIIVVPMDFKGMVNLPNK